MQDWFKGLMTLLLASVILVFLVVWSNYSTLNSGKNKAAEGMANIAVMEGRRGDVVAQLLPVVSAAMQQQRELIDKVTSARAAVAAIKIDGNATPEAMARFAEAQKNFGAALGGLRVAIEANPDLKAMDVVKTFLSQLEGSQNRIAVVSVDYNAAVRSFNTCVTGFFCGPVASYYKFAALPYLDIPTASRQLPDTKGIYPKG